MAVQNLKRKFLVLAGVILSHTSLAVTAEALRTKDITFTWEAVTGASHYQMQENINGQWTNVKSPVSGTEMVMASVQEGMHKFRVGSCIEEIAGTIHCESAGLFSQELHFDPFADDTINKRRVIFIHTDLLGSPAAETDSNGEVLQ